MPIVTLPAPLQGWNTITSFAEIPANQAYVLDNIIPQPGACVSRKGASTYAIGIGSGNVDALFELRALSVNKFVACGGGNIYDITNPLSVVQLGSGFSSNQWDGTVFNATLAICNGVDNPQTYDGTTLANLSVSGSGVTANNINIIESYKNITYFGQINSQDFWYSALSTLGGSLTRFPLSKVGDFGGNLIGIKTLSYDGGNGPNDNICFFMSTGEIIIYQGTNPAIDFVLVGKYRNARPISNRAIVKFGADVLVVTNQGYIPVSSILPLSYGKDESSINTYIKGAASSSVGSFGSLFGWQAVLSPADNILLVNVPQSSTTFYQHVYNVNTNAWCRFTGLNARCWCVFGNTLYYGGTNGTVYSYGPNFVDFGSTQFPQIVQSGYARLTQVPLAYQTQSVRVSAGPTQTTGLRPRALFDSTLNLQIAHSVDFKPMSTPYSKTFNIIGSMWGAPWGSPWAVSNSTINWLSYSTVGYFTSLQLQFTCSGQVTYVETDILIKSGNRI